jgi:methylglutaconyl-CoA hydratase
MNVEVNTDNRVLRLTLANPRKKNILDSPTVSELVALIDKWKGKAEILILQAKGPIFSMGRPRLHPPQASAATDQKAGNGREAYTKSITDVRRLSLLLQEWPGVSIAAVRGGAWGAAAGMLVHCDIVIAEDDAVFAFPEITYGVVPSLVISYLPKYIIRKGAYYMVFSGQEITAQKAAEWGLVTQVVPKGTLDKNVEKIVRILEGLKEGDIRNCKEILVRLEPLDPEVASEKVVKHVATRSWE